MYNYFNLSKGDMKMKKYGLPYQGSKSKIAEKLGAMLPNADFVYMKRVLETSNTGLSKFYLKVCDKEFTLSGIKIRKYSKGDV